MPTANALSPNARIHRSVVMTSVCMNSADRAYHVPCSTDAHVCKSPIGNMLSTTALGTYVGAYSTLRVYHLVNCKFY